MRYFTTSHSPIKFLTGISPPAMHSRAFLPLLANLLGNTEHREYKLERAQEEREQ